MCLSKSRYEYQIQILEHTYHLLKVFVEKNTRKTAKIEVKLPHVKKIAPTNKKSVSAPISPFKLKNAGQKSSSL